MLCLTCLVLGSCTALGLLPKHMLTVSLLKSCTSLIHIENQPPALWDKTFSITEENLQSYSTAEQNCLWICPLTMLTDVLPNIRMKTGTLSLILVICFLCPFIESNVCLQFPVCVLFTLPTEGSAHITHCLFKNHLRAQNTLFVNTQRLWIWAVLSHFTTWMCLSLQGLEMRQIRFRFDGQPINETDTPAQVSLESPETKSASWRTRSVRRRSDRLELASLPPTWFLAFCYST